MKEKLWCVFTGICVFVLSAMWAAPSWAQASEVKEKPAMYSYVANWQIPRAQWADMDKANAADKAILDKALADGTIVGYGTDENLVHQPNNETHDSWWAAMSLAGLIKVLDQFYASSTTTSGALTSATKHWDEILVSRYYNWRAGAWKNGYTHVSAYKLKENAPDDAVDSLSKNLVVPLLEKMLASGAIREYEVDEQAIHTGDPSAFWIIYVASNPDGLDQVDAGIRDALKGQPLAGPAFGSMTESSGHRDELLRGDGIYK